MNKKTVYEVRFVNNINIDNLLSKKNWKDANVLSDFYLPWDKKSAQETRFKALFDESYLYSIFYSKDSNLVVLENISEEMDIAKEDRIEIYLSASESMDEYFCFEVDPYGRVLDYKAKFYRKFDGEWNINQLIVESKINDDGFNTAIAIPLKALKEMNIDVSRKFYVGLFRADLEDSSSGLKENWISWIKPKTSEPDFHVPEALGFFSLMDVQIVFPVDTTVVPSTF